MYKIFVFFYLFLIVLINAKSQSLNDFNPENVRFNYTLGINRDTIACDFFFINGNDTFNKVNTYGKKVGKWYEPNFIEQTITTESYNISGISLTEMIESISSKRDSLTRKAVNILWLQLKPEDSYKFVSNFNFLDPTLKPINNHLYSLKEGYFVEEFWFGYLLGKYTQGKKVGKWYYVPKEDKDKYTLIVTTSSASIYNIFLYDYKRTLKYRRLIKTEGYEVGKYKDGERDGEWLYKADDIFTRRLNYKDGLLLNSETFNTNSDTVFKKEYSIQEKDGQYYLDIYRWDGQNYQIKKYNITHIYHNLNKVTESNYILLFPSN